MPTTPSEPPTDFPRDRLRAQDRAAERAFTFPGLSIQLAYLTSESFRARFGTELLCRRYLLDARWPTAFTCPKCGRLGPRPDPMQKIIRCSYGSCRHKTTLTAQTIFHSSKRPLTLWFKAALLIAQKGANARTLSRELSLTYKIAWTWAHKLRRAMAFEPRAETVEQAIERLARARPHVSVGPNRRVLVGRAGVSEFRAPIDRTEPRACCRRLEKEDWQWPEPEFDPADLVRRRESPDELIERALHPDTTEASRRRQYVNDDGAFARLELGPAYHGGISRKHLNAYLAEYGFKWNHRVVRADPVVALIDRLVRTPRCGYREIIAKQEPAEPVPILLTIPGRPLAIAYATSTHRPRGRPAV